MASVIFKSTCSSMILKQVASFKGLMASSRNFSAVAAKKSLDAQYRSKDVEKLMEMNKKYNILEPGLKVLDIGAAPGSWSQYLAIQTNSNRKDEKSPVGSVIAIDVMNFPEIEGVHILPEMDFFKETSQKKIMEVLGQNEKFDLILSDILPELTGNLKVGGSCLLRVHGAEDNPAIKREARKFFRNVSFPLVIKSRFKPEAYLLARDFKGATKSS